MKGKIECISCRYKPLLNWSKSLGNLASRTNYAYEHRSVIKQLCEISRMGITCYSKKNSAVGGGKNT